MNLLKLFVVTFCLVATAFLPGCKTMMKIPAKTSYSFFSVTFVTEPGAFNPGQLRQCIAPDIHYDIDISSIQTAELTTMEKVQIKVYTTAGEWPEVRMRLAACLNKIFPPNIAS